MYYPGICLTRRRNASENLRIANDKQRFKQASPGYNSRPQAPHQSVRCWAGFIQTAPEHHFNTVPTGFIYELCRLLRINNYLEASFLMGYDIASAGIRTPTFRLRVMDPWSWGQNVLPKRRYQITQWRSIISQNNWILGYTTGKPSCFPEQH